MFFWGHYTSLYNLHEQAINNKNYAVAAVRDKVWKKIFETEEEHLNKRLKKYKPLIIINACTANLKSIVTISINKNFNYTLYEANKHPCLWHSNIKLKKIETL